jgi:hypothetical protein
MALCALPNVTTLKWVARWPEARGVRARMPLATGGWTIASGGDSCDLMQLTRIQTAAVSLAGEAGFTAVPKQGSVIDAERHIRSARACVVVRM